MVPMMATMAAPAYDPYALGVPQYYRPPVGTRPWRGSGQDKCKKPHKAAFC
jgi:hypothetical protein